MDLSQVFGTPPRALPHDRLPPAELSRIRDTLAQHGLKLKDGDDADRKLIGLRGMYEPYVFALANYLNLSLPPWIPQKKGKDNWQTTAWGESAGLVEKKPHAVGVDDHF